MNHRVTSTDLILEKALLIAKREGVDKLSIRKIATSCGIAVGSVYNYYPDKEALVTAMAEVFWNNIFSDQERLYHHGMSFTQFLEWYYSYLHAKMSPYDGSWVRDLEGKIPADATVALLMQVLKEDEKVNNWLPLPFATEACQRTFFLTIYVATSRDFVYHLSYQMP